MGRVRVFFIVALIVSAFTFLLTETDEMVESDADGTGAPVETTAVQTPDDQETVPVDQEPPPGFDSYSNRAGYSFHHPESWSVDERGTAVEVLAPDASAVMSFGLAPSGDIRAGIGTFLEAIEETYEVLEVRGPSSEFLGTAQTTAGVAVEGIAINDDGVRVEFTALVVEGTDRNYAIAVFASSKADHGDVQAVLNSFATS